MSTFVDMPLHVRLRRERERVGLTQDDMAAKMGVSRVTQGHYESGRRSPDAVYLTMLPKLGIDGHFVAFGESATATDVYELGVLKILPQIAAAAGIDANALWEVLHLAAEAESLEVSGRPETERVQRAAFDELVGALFYNGGRLFGKVVNGVREQVAELRVSLPPRARVEVLLALYRTFRARGRFDGPTLQASVSVACSFGAVPLDEIQISKATEAVVRQTKALMETQRGPGVKPKRP